MGREGSAPPPGFSLGFQVHPGNQQSLSLDQELFLCLWQPSQSKMLANGHNVQRPPPPRTVRLFPACKNNKQLPEQRQPSFPRLSPWWLLLPLSLRLDHVAGGWSPEGLDHFVVSPRGSFQLPFFAKQALSSSVDTGQSFQSCWQRMDKQTDSCYGPNSPIAVEAWKTNSSNPVYRAPLYPKSKTIFQGWENPSHQGGGKYQHLTTNNFKGSNPSFGLRLGGHCSEREEGRNWCLGGCSGSWGAWCQLLLLG